MISKNKEIELMMQMKRQMRDERERHYRAINDLDIENIVMRWEHKLGIRHDRSVSLHLRLDAVMENLRNLIPDEVL